MAGPFYNAIKGTTSGTPGTGAFTPSAASSGFLAWSTVPTGWIGLVRFEDGTDWELQYCYWNGTTLSRSATTQFVSSSTGSALTLTSAATAAMVVDGGEVQPLLSVPLHGYFASIGAASPSSFGMVGASLAGTGSTATLATTNFLTEQSRLTLTSATTANAQAGVSNGGNTVAVVNTSAGRGGGEFVCRFGASGLPTGPRVFIGFTSTTFVGNTGEPSALVAHVAALAKDSTDTNLQILTNSNAGSGTKIDTGIALVANGWYEFSVWIDPGSTTVRYLLVRLDTGAIFYGSTTTDVPANGALLMPQCLMGLNGTNTGTAVVQQFGRMIVRNGAG